MSAPRDKQEPKLHWDGTKRRWDVFLPVQNEDGSASGVAANWNQLIWTVLRIRKQAHGSEWSPGFETPISSITFSDFDPCAVYEVEMWFRDSAGDGPRKVFEIRTDKKGRPISMNLVGAS